MTEPFGYNQLIDNGTERPLSKADRGPAETRDNIGISTSYANDCFSEAKIFLHRCNATEIFLHHCDAARAAVSQIYPSSTIALT